MVITINYLFILVDIFLKDLKRKPREIGGGMDGPHLFALLKMYKKNYKPPPSTMPPNKLCGLQFREIHSHVWITYK